jgi:hypothetical protein
MKRNSLKPKFVGFMPNELEEGILYISLEYCTASHLCACGCGSKVVTPLSKSYWTLHFDGTVSLTPSIGNYEYRCKSHYYITSNQVIWLDGVRRDDDGTRKRKKLKRFKLSRKFPFVIIA